jgi:hypothetical protein
MYENNCINIERRLYQKRTQPRKYVFYYKENQLVTEWHAFLC